jgi:hypothetical protein
MGIRIKKDIGYLLPYNDMGKIIVSNYEDILEGFDYEPEKISEFYVTLVQLMKGYKSKKNVSENYFINIYADMFDKYLNQPIYNLVTELLMGDDNAGMLFRSPELFKASRNDDLMDYYEISEEAHEIKYLNRPIYPTTGYIYTGGLEDKHPDLVVGTVYDNYVIKYDYLSHLPKDDLEENLHIINSGHFIPNVEVLVFLVAQAAGILLPTVTEYDFNCAVKPMIATYWS